MITRNWKNIVAWASVCLNVVLVALILIKPPFIDHPPGPPSPEKIFSHMGEELTGTDKAIFEDILQKHIPEMHLTHENMRPAFDKIQQLVLAEPFDLEKVKAAHHELIATRNKIDEAIESFILELLSNISEEGRKKIKIGPPAKPK